MDRPGLQHRGAGRLDHALRVLAVAGRVVRALRRQVREQRIDHRPDLLLRRLVRQPGSTTTVPVGSRITAGPFTDSFTTKDSR